MHIVPFVPINSCDQILHWSVGMRAWGAWPRSNQTQILLVMYGVQCGQDSFLLVCTMCIAVNILYIWICHVLELKTVFIYPGHPCLVLLLPLLTALSNPQLSLAALCHEISAAPANLTNLTSFCSLVRIKPANPLHNAIQGCNGSFTFR